jgi:hypothetical protein
MNQKALPPVGHIPGILPRLSQPPNLEQGLFEMCMGGRCDEESLERLRRIC